MRIGFDRSHDHSRWLKVLYGWFARMAISTMDIYRGGTFIFLQVFTGHPRDDVSGDYPGVLMILSLFISSSEKK